ncbi:MAG: hypothetical protein OXC31_19070 [Spirochaetaceae bacterium]|nr:hypothetical protein [Spirochaetaceae bacterium]
MNKTILHASRAIAYSLIVGLVAATAGAQPSDSQSAAACLTHSPTPNGPQASGTSSIAYQEFPASGPLETAWYVTFDHDIGKALFITGAYFMPAPNREFVQVLGRAGLSELFVPYQSGNPRYADLSGFSFDLVEVTARDTGPCGRIVGRDDKVVREVVDKGPLWKNDDLVVRGQKLLLWGTLDAANYNYIIRYEFHDDGTIKFRIAGTAVNLPGQASEPHTHNALWRIDVNLNGHLGDSVYVLRHVETVGSPSWQNAVTPFNGGREGPTDFAPTEFTQIAVVDSRLINGFGEQTSYELRPLYRGVVRHAELYLRNDFWVTVNRPIEQYFPDLLQYVNDEPIQDADVVLWHVTPMLHLPRSEDGVALGSPYANGVALAMWAGFDMRPRNLFDRTPFYPSR